MSVSLLRRTANIHLRRSASMLFPFFTAIGEYSGFLWNTLS